MDVTSSTYNGTEVIRLRGRFDFSAHREFRPAVNAAFANSAIQEVQIDLGAVDYIDSSALGLLLVIRDEAKKAGKTVSLYNAAGIVKQALSVSKFEKLFAIN